MEAAINCSCNPELNTHTHLPTQKGLKAELASVNNLLKVTVLLDSGPLA